MTWAGIMKVRLAAGALLLVVLLIGSPRSGAAKSWSYEGMDFAFDTTLSFGVSLRTESPDPKNYCTTIGGPNALAPPPIVPAGAGTRGVNGDCGKSAGNLNYEKWSPYSTILKGIHEFEVRRGAYSGLVRFQWWYDGINEHGDRARTPLTDLAKWRTGAGAELLDAYVQGNWYPFDMPVALKVGNQVVSWGESTFFQNGINVINPIDVSKLRVPGAELREALLAVPMAWGSLSPSQYVSLEAFYQFQWRETYLDPPGTYWSVHDAVGPGGTFFDISQGHHDCDIDPTGVLLPGPGAVPIGIRQDGTLGATCIERGRDLKSRDEGQYGFAARLFVPALVSSEFGVFFLNYHSRVPIVSGQFQETLLQAGQRVIGPGYTPGASPLFDLLASNAVLRGTRAQLFYPEDIKKVGVTFSTAVDEFSLAIQGEATWTFDQPLQLSEIELLRGLFGSAGIPGTPAAPGTPTALPGQFFSGAIEKDVVTAQSTFTYVGEPGEIIGGWLKASQLLVVFEMGYMRIVDYDDPAFLPLQGSVTPQSIAAGNTANQFSSFATRNSMGYVVRAALPYNNLFRGINVQPFVGWSHGIWGVSPSPLLNYVEGEKAINVGVGFDYLNQWFFTVNYANYFGGGVDNPRNDRDFLAFDIKYAF